MQIVTTHELELMVTMARAATKKDRTPLSEGESYLVCSKQTF